MLRVIRKPLTESRGMYIKTCFAWFTQTIGVFPSSSYICFLSIYDYRSLISNSLRVRLNSFELEPMRETQKSRKTKSCIENESMVIPSMPSVLKMSILNF